MALYTNQYRTSYIFSASLGTVSSWIWVVSYHWPALWSYSSVCNRVVPFCKCHQTYACSCKRYRGRGWPAEWEDRWMNRPIWATSSLLANSGVRSKWRNYWLPHSLTWSDNASSNDIHQFWCFQDRKGWLRLFGRQNAWGGRIIEMWRISYSFHRHLDRPKIINAVVTWDKA